MDASAQLAGGKLLEVRVLSATSKVFCSSMDTNLRNSQAPLQTIAPSGASEHSDSSVCTAKPSQALSPTVDATTEWKRPPLWVTASALMLVLFVIAVVLLAACGRYEGALLAVPPALLCALALAIADVHGWAS